MSRSRLPFLLLMIALIVLSTVPGEVHAQDTSGETCVSVTGFPHPNFGWVITLGVPDTSDSSYLMVNSSSLIDGGLQWRASAYLLFDTPRQITSVQIRLFNWRINNTDFSRVEARAGQSSAEGIINRFGYADFNLGLAPNLTTKLEVNGYRVTGSFTEKLSFTVINYCYTLNPAYPQPPTSTATPTGTLTGTLAATRTPTLTPTSTFTRTPTYTPGGPTLTPSLTVTGPTPGPGTATATMQGVGGSMVLQNGNAPIPCDACGQPLIVPGFSTIVLPSPTKIATIALMPSETPIYSTGTYTGTPPTVAPSITPSFSVSDNSLVSYATRVADGVGMIGSGDGGSGFGIGDSQSPGFMVDIANGAFQVSQQIGILFSMARSFQSNFLGKSGTFILLVLTIIGLSLVVRLTVWIIPIFSKLASLWLQFISTLRQMFSI